MSKGVPASKSDWPMKHYDPVKLVAAIDALRFVLAEREAELMELKGPCSNKSCRLHYAHSGPCLQNARPA